MFCSKWVLLLIYIAVILTIYMAVIVENPVFSVLFLIFGFVGLCSILIMCYADYLGVLFVLVYGGAISILIMFVVMMLDLKDMQFRDGEHNNAYKHFMGGTSLLFITILSLTDDPVSHLPKLAYYRDWYRIFEMKSNIEVVGLVIYDHYLFQFMFIGFLLFISMIVIISLVIRKQTKARHETLYNQIEQSNVKMLIAEEVKDD